MNSEIIGGITFDQKELQAEIETILTFPFSSSYSEYALGEWKNCVLWNQTGTHTDSGFVRQPGQDLNQKPTELGQQLPYINDLLLEYFRFEYLRSIRVFSVKNGMIIPHRDYLGSPDHQRTRVHVPIQTDLSCLHSEHNEVFHMRKGEVWFLDANRVHSAGSFSGINRLSITLDFDPQIPFTDLVKSPNDQVVNTPQIIDRPPITEEYLETILQLGQLIDAINFDNIVAVLAKIHFLRLVDNADMYDWLIEISERSRQAELISRAKEMKRYFLGENNSNTA